MNVPRSQNLVRLTFEGGFNADDEADAEDRGYRSLVWAELDDGTRHALTFYDMARLGQTLQDEFDAGRPYFSEPGWVVVPRVTRDAMESAARKLAQDGFFARR